jgi:uncharacterized protein (DUF433 family)
MSTNAELLTPTEAAVVAGVSVREVHRVIDERIVPDSLISSKKGGRWLKSDACAFVMFYYYSAPSLTSHERSLVIRHICGEKTRNWVVHHGYLTVDLHHFHEETRDRHAALMKAREMVVEDPDILGGTPVIRGTRIPVHDVAASAAAGVEAERLKAAYPGLDDAQIELASLYAQANPPRGRPRGGRAAPPDLKLVSERKVARRRA